MSSANRNTSPSSAGGKVSAITHGEALITEPVVIDLAQKREPAPQSMSPYGDFDTLFKTRTDQLGKGPYLLGETFSAAAVLWAQGRKRHSLQRIRVSDV